MKGIKKKLASHAGQGLILAVLIMILLALVGGAFVALISYNISQTGRLEDVVTAQYLAESGIRYASEQLTYSPEGADWRPPAPPPMSDANFINYFNDLEISRGWVGFSKVPNPLVSGAPSTTMIGRGIFLLKIEYNPVDSDPMSKFIKITSIGRIGPGAGVYRVLVAYKPIALTDYLWFVTNKDNSTNPARLGHASWLDYNGDGTRDVSGGEDVVANYYGSIRVNGDLEWNGWNSVTLDSSKKQQVEVAGQISQVVPTTGAPTGFDASHNVRVNTNLTEPSSGGFNTFSGLYRDRNLSTPMDDRKVIRLDPPRVDVWNPTTNKYRYYQLTTDSGQWSYDSAGSMGPFNSGWFGFGDGMYIDNRTETQFNHDGNQLESNWLRSGDPYLADQSWNQNVYTPPGVEIFLRNDESGSFEGTAPNRRHLKSHARHIEKSPVMIITRHDHTWWTPFADDGTLNTIYRDTGVYQISCDYPKNGIIYVEGNVRIRGTLPRSGYDLTPQVQKDSNGYALPGWNYNLTVVSNGTIYIDGNLLRPSDVNTAVTDTRENSHIALLAKDYVCLNSTQFMSALSNSTVESDQPGAGAPYHWLVDKGQYVGGWFSFGQAPAAGNTLSLTVRHCGENPGPANINLQVNGSAYNWDTTGAQYTYQFLPPPPPAGGLSAWQSNALSPNYTRSDWTLSTVSGGNGYVYTNPGYYSFLNFQLDPSSSTKYWLSRYKISQTDASNNVTKGMDIVVSALIYAEGGSWFVIPGDFFDSSATGTDSFRYRRFNYAVTVNGSISENRTPDPSVVSNWVDKMAWPLYSSSAALYQWQSIAYNYDSSLKSNRALGLPALPCMPTCPALIYFGETS